MIEINTDVLYFQNLIKAYVKASLDGKDMFDIYQDVEQYDVCFEADDCTRENSLKHVLKDVLKYPANINLMKMENNKYSWLDDKKLYARLKSDKVIKEILDSEPSELPKVTKISHDIVINARVLVSAKEFNSCKLPFYIMLRAYFRFVKTLSGNSSKESLIGTFNNGINAYFITLNQTKSGKTWYLFSSNHKDDLARMIRGEAAEHRTLYEVRDIELGYHLETIELNGKKVKTSPYLVCAFKQSATGVITYSGNVRMVKTFQTFLSTARNYSFDKNSIQQDRNVFDESGVFVKEFAGSDSNITYKYTKSGQIYNSLYIKDNARELDLTNQLDKFVTLGDLEYSPMVSEKISVDLNDVDFSMLNYVMDLSWYVDANGNYLKDYRVIENKKQVEEWLIGGFIDEYQKQVAKGEKVILAVDTETDGLNILNLAPDNPYKNSCVSIPIAFKDDQAFVIFTDMEYHDNVPNDWIWERLKPLLERDVLNDDNNKFMLSVDSSVTGYEKSCMIDRNNIILVGHNVMFDGRVAYDNGVQPEWDEDTLQMAFNINPTIIKGNNGLKNLEWKLLGIEAPELTDILGKRNEDKYRLLRDKEVAKIYGCADADGTRGVYKKLLEIMPNDMYKSYKKLDVPMLNRLYVSEYNGLRMEADKVKVLADQCAEDLEKIKEFLYRYIGRYVYLNNFKTRLDNGLKSGIITKEQYIEAIKNIDLTQAKDYRFEMKGSSYQDVFYNILNYPVFAYTETGQPKVDKNARKMLRSVKGTPLLKFDEDLPVYNGKGESILPASKLNKVKYPVAMIIDEYSILDKEYTAYFKPILENNLEGKMFAPYSMTRIETRRIMNRLQTMKGSLKELTIAYDDDYYLVDFDMSQVEYREMAVRSNFTPIIEKMKDPEKDYHTETAAMVNDIPAHKVSKKLRKGTKSISFGIPYGLGDRSLCINMHGDDSPSHMYETGKLLVKFKTNNKPVIDMVEGFRDNALKEWDMPKALRDYLDAYKVDDFGNKHPIKYGRVTNFAGYHRLFDLTGTNIRPRNNTDKKPKLTDSGLVLEGDSRRIGIIRRAAGNYPIQSGAAEKFRTILMNFYYRTLKEGIADKCLWHMLIHDELILSVHKSINPFFIFKIIYEECMLSVDDVDLDKFFFCGINLGANWGECKDDANEAPVEFVRRMVERYDAGEFDGMDWFEDPKAFVDKYRHQYLIDRIGEVFTEIQPNIDNEPIDMELLSSSMTNYTVRAYLMDFFTPPVPKDKYSKLSDGAKFYVNLEYWAYQKYGTNKSILIEGQVIPVKQRVVVDLGGLRFGEQDADIREMREELVDDDYWDDSMPSNVMLETGFKFDENAETFSATTNISDLVVFDTYQRKYVSKSNDTVFVKVPLQAKLQVKKILQSYSDRDGYRIFLGTRTGSLTPIGKLSKEIDLNDLDKEIGRVITNG